MKNDIENLNKMYSEPKHEVEKCEDVIEQLTQELNSSQEELSMSQNRVKECEENIKNLKDRNHDLQSEVSALEGAGQAWYLIISIPDLCHRLYCRLVGRESDWKSGPEVINICSFTFQLSKKCQLLLKTNLLKSKDFFCFQTFRCCIYHANKC